MYKPVFTDIHIVRQQTNVEHMNFKSHLTVHNDTNRG